jgi:hypothetical protein
LTAVTVTAYTEAIVMGTLTSSASLNSELGIDTGGALRKDPAGGGGRVKGSLLGGNLKSEEDGMVRRTCEEAILYGRWRADEIKTDNVFK